MVCKICDRVNRADRVDRAKGFLRRKVVYLKDHSPYPDSSFFVVNLRIQLELICWVATLLVVTIVDLLFIPIYPAY